MNDIIKYNKKDITPAELFLRAGHESLSPATRKAYETDLNAFFKVVGKDIPEVTALDIPVYIQSLEAAGYRNSTINRKVYSLSKIFNLYILAGVMDKNPIAELNKVKSITRNVSRQINAQVELEDVQKVMSAGNRTAMIINVLANTGLRISELISIKHTDIEDYIKGGKTYKRIRIVGKRNKERFIYLSGDLYKDIKNTFFGNSEYLFHSESGKALNRANLYKQIKQTFQTYTGKDVHPHSLRHFYATHKINTEKQDIKAVSKYLGHSKTAITLDMYVDTALSPENSMILHN